MTAGMSVKIDASTVLARSTPEGEAEYRTLVTQLRQLWPDLEAIAGQPSLSAWDSWNGLALLGETDDSPSTRTYRTFRVLRLVGIPFIFFGAYRAYRTSRGAVLVGRHPLPGWARLWNLIGIPSVVLMFVLFFAGLVEPLLR